MNLGIICEFNPFHKGHRHLIDSVKNDGDGIICCMSGNFVQRGEPAVYEKFSRAKTAVENGADLVIELPTLCSTQSAQGFAKAGVTLLESTGICDMLCFGAESADTSALKSVAQEIKQRDSEIKEELKKHGLSSKELKITDDTVYQIIESYTREAGVRGLKKEIAALCRKAILLLDEGAKSVRISAKNISDFLGTEKYIEDYYSDTDQVGTVNGLAWTQVGGTVLPIEVSALDGTGKIELTGNLGDVMKESAKTAVSYVRSRAESYGIEKDFYKKKDIHIHAPEAAVPKDGPSAGLALTTALVSELCNIPIK